MLSLLFARFLRAERALSGVWVGGVDASGQSATALQGLLSTRSGRLASQPLTLQLGDRRATVPLGELGITLAAPESARRALAVGRDAGWFRGALRFVRSLAVSERLPAVLRVDEPRFDAALSRLQAELLEDPPFEGCIVVDSGVARASPPRAGRKVPRDAALRAISEVVAQGEWGTPVALPSVRETPQLAPGSLSRALEQTQRALARTVVLEAGARRLELEPAELGALFVCHVDSGAPQVSIDEQRLEAWLALRRGNLEAPARDAAFEVSAGDEVTVVPGAPGVKLVTAAVRDAIARAAESDSHRAELPLLLEPLPQRSTEQAEKLGIHRLVGAFTTRHPCCQPRVENIHRIAQLLDGLVVEPGQQVSVNAIVGPRTLKNGFVLAPSIEDGEMVDTIGGGVSQFATTLFNALFRSGYEILERKPHTYWFPRYPMGIEATLSWPHPDILFKNDTAAGLLVKTSFTDKSITVKLYGDVGGRRVMTRVSERRDIIMPSVELLPNRAVPADEEKVKDGGSIGWTVLVERTVTFTDGSKREDKRKVTYKPKPRRVEVHPCRIPRGELGSSGEPCPEPEPDPEPESAPEPAAQPG